MALIVGGIGAIACGVGILVTYPIALIGTAYTYKKFTEPGRPDPADLILRPAASSPEVEISGPSDLELDTLTGLVLLDVDDAGRLDDQLVGRGPGLELDVLLRRAVHVDSPRSPVSSSDTLVPLDLDPLPVSGVISSPTMAIAILAGSNSHRPRAYVDPRVGLGRAGRRRRRPRRRVVAATPPS